MGKQSKPPRLDHLHFSFDFDGDESVDLPARGPLGSDDKLPDQQFDSGDVPSMGQLLRERQARQAAALSGSQQVSAKRLSTRERPFSEPDLPVEADDPVPMSELLGEEELLEPVFETPTVGTDFDEPLPAPPPTKPLAQPHPRMTATSSSDPSLPLIETQELPAMESLLATEKPPPPTPREVLATVSAVREHCAVVAYDGSREGLLGALEFGADWPPEPGDRVRLEVTVVAEQRPQLALLELLGEKPRLAGLDRFVIDGSNVCRSYDVVENASNLAPLLTLCLALRRATATFHVVFDANERYLLARNRQAPAGPGCYERLLTRAPESFSEAPGATDADEYILRRAEREEAGVISNDRYRELGRYFPWLTATDRTFRGDVDEGTLAVPGLGLRCPLRHDLQAMVSELLTEP